MAFMGVNWLAVLVGAVIHMFPGILGYSSLFAQMWPRKTGERGHAIRSNSSMYVVTGVAARVSLYVLAVFIGTSVAADLVSGALIGIFVLVGIGAIFPVWA